MDFAPTYLIQRFFYRFFSFFSHWYVDGSRAFGRRFISTLQEIDKVIALKITFRFLFQPLYKDYTIMGRILGIIFRTLRIVVGLAVYLMVIPLFVAAYLVWIFIPVAILAYAVR